MIENEIGVFLLGDKFVGKTSIIKRIKDGTFDDNISKTLDPDIFLIKRKYERINSMIELLFYDTPGTETKTNFFLNKIKNFHIILLVFSDIQSLNVLIDRWHKYYKKEINLDYPRFVLVGNKSDTFGKDREEIYKKGEIFAEEIDAHFLTCSAKNGDNLDNLDRYIYREATRYIDEKRKKQ